VTPRRAAPRGAGRPPAAGVLCSEQEAKDWLAEM